MAPAAFHIDGKFFPSPARAHIFFTKKKTKNFPLREEEADQTFRSRTDDQRYAKMKERKKTATAGHPDAKKKKNATPEIAGGQTAAEISYTQKTKEEKKK